MPSFYENGDGIRVENRISLQTLMKSLPRHFPTTTKGIVQLYLHALNFAYSHVDLKDAFWGNEITRMVHQLYGLIATDKAVYNLRNLDMVAVAEMARYCAINSIQDTDFYLHYIHQGLLAYVIGAFGPHDTCATNARNSFNDIIVRSRIHSDRASRFNGDQIHRDEDTLEEGEDNEYNSTPEEDDDNDED